MPVRGYTPSYRNESPYRVTPIIGNFMGYYIHRAINPQSDDVLTTMDKHVYEARPDLLANDIYGTPDLWWVFGVRNGWKDPVYDLKLGIVFYIPQETYVRSIL